MSEYLLAALMILGLNLLPAFGPPTWILLVYLTLTLDLEAVPLIVLAVVSAAVGRFLMANGVRKLRLRFPKKYVENMTNLGQKIVSNTLSIWGLFLLFIWSPLSSAQMFVVAGLLPQVNLGILTVAFAIGRCFTYSAYVYGAHEFSHTDVGQKLISEMTSPWMIAIQVVLVIGVVALGRIKWKPEVKNG